MTGKADDGTPYNASTSFIVTETDPSEYVNLVIVNYTVALKYEVAFNGNYLRSAFTIYNTMPDGDFEYSTFIFGLFY